MSATDPSFDDELRRLRQDQIDLQRRLNELSMRIHELEQREVDARPMTPPASAPDTLAPQPETVPPTSPVPPGEPPGGPADQAPAPAAAKEAESIWSPPPPTAARSPEEPPAKRAEGAELVFGRTWLNRIGAVILVLAFGFFIKYSFDQGWLSPTMRVILGYVAGVILIGIGEYCLRRTMRVFATGLIGCGGGVLYLACFGAYNFYHLVETQAAGLLFICVTVLSVSVAVHGRLLPIAVIGLIGGFWTPLALRTGVDQQVTLLTYILVLDLGFIVCATIRRWDVIRVLCWLGTAILFGMWFVEFYSGAFAAAWRTAGFILAFYVLFHGEAFLALVWRSTSWPRAIERIIYANNVVFFASIYFFLRDVVPQWMGLFAVATAALQWLMAWRLRSGEALTAPSRTALWLNGAGMLALAAPMQFDRYMVSLSWAVQAVVTLWFCRRIDRPWLRVKAAGIWLAAAIHLQAFERTDPQLMPTLMRLGEHWTLSWVILCFVFVGLCAYAGGVVLAVRRPTPNPDQGLAKAAIVLGSALLLFVFADQWECYLATWWWLGLAGVWWLLARRVPGAGIMAVVLALVTAVKFLAWDTISMASDSEWQHLHGVVLNRAVVTGVLIAVFVILLRPTLARLPAALVDQIGLREAGMVLLLIGSLVIIWTGTFEIMRVFRFEALRESYDDPRLAMQVGLSIFWAISATVLLIIGFARRIAPLRHMALVIFAITIVKVLTFDMAKQEMLYRIVSFFVLGVLLLFASLLYQRLSSRIATTTPAHNEPQGPA